MLSAGRGQACHSRKEEDPRWHHRDVRKGKVFVDITEMAVAQRGAARGRAAAAAAAISPGSVVSQKSQPLQGWGRAGAAGYRFARDDKEPGAQLGAKQLPGERPRETAET